MFHGVIPTVIDQNPCAHLRMPRGHDLPWLVDEVVPGLAAQRDDVFVGFEDPVRQPVVAHELPDILHRVQLGRSWRQRQDGDVVGDRQLGRQVPTGLIDDQHRMGAGIDGGTDLDEVRRHGVGVAPGHDQPGAFPLRGTDRAEDIGPFGALVAGRPRARATSGPSACELILLADAGFILPPQLYLDAFREPRPDLRQFGGEVFFKSLDGQLVLRVVARPRRDLGEAERLQLAPDRGLVERDGERLQEPPRQVLAPPAHDAVDRRDRAGLNNLRQCAAVIGVELRGCAR